MKIARKLGALMMTLCIFCTMFAPAAAYMWPVSSPSSLNVKTYTLSSTANVDVYDSASLSRRSGSVYPSDLITLLEASGNAVKVRYPISGNRTKDGWLPVSALSKGALNTGYSLAMKAGGSVPVYRRETGSATIGSIDAGDTVYLVYAGLDHNTGRAQLIYPISGGWKMGWVNFSDIDKTVWRACGGSQVIPDGTYRIGVSASHSLDGQGPNNNVHTWQNLDVPQQKVELRYCGSGLYSARFLHNGLYLDAFGGGSNPTNLGGWEGNNTLAQRFYIADLGGGRYGLFNAASGLALDVDHYQTRTNGSNIQTWRFNGQSVSLTRLDKSSAPAPAPSSDTWQYPLANTYVCGNDWSQQTNRSRPDHCGIDIKSSTGSRAVCAAAAGTVVKSGWNSANGYYVVIQHSLSGKTVYSFYAHLSSITKSSGAVQKGQQIGVIGNTGSVSNGEHLHFAVTNTLWNGSYYGYTPSFTGDKVSYQGVTYYNPHFVVSRDALPN